jgi:hypothetical protein
MSENERPVRDPTSAEHKRFVLGQVRLRHWLMAAFLLALVLWLLLE